MTTNCIALGLAARCWLLRMVPYWPLPVVVAVVLTLRLPVAIIPTVTAVHLMLVSFFCWVLVGEWRPASWAGRFGRRVVRYRAEAGGRVAILFPPELAGQVDLAAIIRQAEADLDDLAGRFGHRPGRRLRIVLVPDQRDLAADFGGPLAGVALARLNAVVLAADGPLEWVLRHELAHLFAVPRNVAAPPLLQEGLAVWLESSGGSLGVAEFGRPQPSPWPSLAQMLDRRYFFSSTGAAPCYAAAGVFTGFLIRRHGWDRYWRFYRRADRWTIRLSFRWHFGATLDDAWRRCPDATLALAMLDRRLRNDDLFTLRR